ncbi:MAG: universal stress protein, partial [Candidatus Nitrosotalea sp.]|nr:universal stress protein [Candidatus Nitrosotalea sp.]
LKFMNVGKFSKILVAIDGSEMSMKAAEYGVAMAKKDTANLVIISVIYTPASTFTYTKQEWFDEFLKKSKDESAKWFDKVKKNAAQNGVQVKVETVEELYSIPAAIVKYAENENADLIIMGSTGKTGFKRLLLGSVANDVVIHSPIPVMIIKS